MYIFYFILNVTGEQWRVLSRKLWSDQSFKMPCAPLSVSGLFYSGVWLGLETGVGDWEHSALAGPEIGCVRKIPQKTPLPPTGCWTTDAFYKMFLWNVIMTGFIDTCNLISEFFNNCAVSIDKAWKKWPRGAQRWGQLARRTSSEVDVEDHGWGWRGWHNPQLAPKKRQSGVIGAGEVWFVCDFVLIWFFWRHCRE